MFHNPDYKWANELTVKTAFLTLLYNDILYIMDSEVAIGRGYCGGRRFVNKKPGGNRNLPIGPEPLESVIDLIISIYRGSYFTIRLFTKPSGKNGFFLDSRFDLFYSCIDYVL